MLLLQAIPKEQLEESAFITTYGAYMGMLNNFERYRDNAIQSGRQIVSSIVNTLPDHVPAGERECHGPLIASSTK
jgi:hypothetical protein